MSDHKRSTPAPGAVDRPQLDFETALRLATIMADANERLFKIQSEAANAAFAENSKHLRALLDPANARDSNDLLAQWMDLYQANMRRALDVTRSCFEIVPQTQAEIAKLVGEPFASANQETQQHLDQLTRAISDGRDAAAATVKDFLTQAMAGAGATQPVKEEKID
jgi:phasin family protein